MSKTKAAQIAEALNKYHAERPFDFRQVAEAAAVRLGVALYWSGTASLAPAEPCAEVWQMNARGKWMRRIGMVRLNGSAW